MNQPRWKKLLSYVYPFKIESTSSEFNEVLEVFLVKGRYQLCAERAIYSHQDLYKNFRHVFAGLPFDKLEGNKALVLGLGLGSVPEMLENMTSKQFEITAVEIDEEVVYLFHKYIQPSLKKPINIIVANATFFVASCSSKFDLIAIDVYDDVKIPEDFRTKTFIEKIERLLRPNGIAIYNEMVIEGEEFYNSAWKAVFPDSTAIKVGQNNMLLNRPIE